MAKRKELLEINSDATNSDRVLNPGRIVTMLAALLCSLALHALQDNRGTDFWLTFGENYYYSAIQEVDLQIRIVAGSEPADVTLHFTQNNTDATFHIAANQVVTYNLDNTIEQPLVYNETMGTTNLSVRITSTAPVAAYALNQGMTSTDATHILPVQALGTDYFHISYMPTFGGMADAYAVIATENNTQVFHNGAVVATLNAGQVYYRRLVSGDMTGSRITSDKPVALFSMCQIANVPYRAPVYTAADHLFEQMAPVNTWGTNFFVPVSGLGKDVVRVVASQDGTNLVLTGGKLVDGTLGADQPVPPGAQTTLTNLQAGQWVEILVTSADKGCFIQADNPVGVCTYLASQQFVGSTNTDPSIAWMPPIEQMIPSALIAPFVPQSGLSKLNLFYALIVTPTATKNETRVSTGGAAPVALSGTWTDHASGYSYNTMQLSNNSATSYLFTNPDGNLFIMGYGTGETESYYYLAGSAMRNLDGDFYVNEIVSSDLANETICTQPLQFRADLIGDLSTLPGFLKWYFNGTEVTAARDSMTWSTTLPSGTYQVKMEARMNDEVTIKTVEGTMTVLFTQAHNDYVQTLINTPVNVSVLDNDSLGCCGLSGITGLSILTNATHGTANLNGNILTYTPNTGFTGKDSVTYTYDCSGTVNTAKVYITVSELPDNISDADCYIDAPPTVWDIELKAVTDNVVHALSTPWVGDLDGDGRNEVVVPNDNGVDFNSTAMLVFDDSLRLISTITVPGGMPEEGTMTNLIADVDNDGSGEIVVVTNNMNLMCYGMYGNVKWTSSSQISFRSLPGYCPSPVIADINSDGFSEILAVDNIFDAATGRLIAELPSGGGRGRAAGGPAESYMPVFADMDGDGLQEVVAGNTVYKVNITNRAGTAGNTVSVLAQINRSDGFTSVADIDLDGDLDVVVTGAVNDANKNQNQALFYVWDGETSAPVGDAKQFASAESRISRAFIGDIDGDGRPDIAFTCVNRMEAWSYDPVGNVFTPIFSEPTTDSSGATTMSMFDFNLDGEVELVYRDESDLRIIDKNGDDLVAFSCVSATHTEYPVVVDLDGDRSADILVSGVTGGYSGTRIARYGSITPGAWASARSVWNQHAYNATNTNEDLSVPQFPMNNTTIFPGHDGILGTADDLRPFNSFLQQQTALNLNGEPLWLVPDVHTNQSLIQTTLVGDSLAVTVKFVNSGDAAIGAPIYVSLYKETPSPQLFAASTYIATDSVDVQLFPGDTAEVILKIPDITAFFPMANLVVRLNDDGKTFPVQPECNYANDTVTVPNPAIGLMMKKRATLNGVQDNGRYPNPVSVLFSEEILYEITAVNASAVSGQNIVITDTLPPYLRYVGGSASHSGAWASLTSLAPPRESITWIAAVLPGLAPLDSVTVSFRATPVSGAVASQPLFINTARVSILSSNVTVPTNSTYHQGAGVAVVTFSASVGGWIFNAGEQALDYRTTPRSGIEVIPEEGYEFAGWSHDAYTSLRGETVPADSGLMDYEDIVIQGNVELRANFIPANRDRYIGIVEEEQIPEQPETDRVWAVGDMLYVTPAKAGSVLRIYTVEGVLREQHALVSAGTSTYRLPRGVYIVTVNGGGGRKIASL